MKNTLLVLSITAMISVGCVSHEQAKQMFVQHRNFDQGRSVREVPLPPLVRVEPINDKTSLYIYEFKATGCRWSYTVDNETKKILSWKYISDPDLCYMKVNYGGG